MGSKMATYHVYVRKTLDGEFTVEADSQAAAEVLAEQQLATEIHNIIWDDSDEEIIGIEPAGE